MIVSYSLRFVLAVVLLCACSVAKADTKTITITQPSHITSHFEYTEDTSGNAGIDQIIDIPEDQWHQAQNGSANFGMTKSPYWLRFSVNNQTAQNLNLIAALEYPQLDDVIFYTLSDKTTVHVFATGDTRPFYPREVDHPSMLMRFDLAPNQMKTIYIRVQTDGSMILPLQIWRESDFYAAAAKEQKIDFFYFGCLTVIILINFAVFLTLRETLYLYYAIAIAGYLLFFTSILGYSFQHFYPQAPSIHGRALLTSMPILALFSVLFCREFLKTKSNSPKLDIALRAMIYFEVFNVFSALFLSYNTAIIISAISAFFFFSVLFVAGPIAWAKGMRVGIFFTIAWTPLTVGVLATAGRSLGFFPENFMTQYAMQIGSGLEAFILTLALADRLYREREDKIAAQADNLDKEKARNEAHYQLAEAMMRDPITHLPNRNRFERMVNQQLQQDPTNNYIVGMARITRLDEIYRTLGLTRSEQLLSRIAERMTEMSAHLPDIHSIFDDMGRKECIYQLSDDCFGLLLNPSQTNDNFKSLNSALKVMSEPFIMDNLAIELHPKFGVAKYPIHGKTASLLIRNAHVGMDMTPHNKQEAGFYSPDYDIYSESRLTLMSDLREALHLNQTELYYQPKVSLITGKVVSIEALIRWHHPERGRVYPNDFIPLAEETGVITQLTKWAFKQGIKDLADIQSEHPNLGLSVNISARDLTSGDLSESIESALKRYHIDAKYLTVELTETAAMVDPEKGLIILKKLTDIGLHVSIDDFGSGYSSLSYLKELPATEIKLDRSLIMDICGSESSKVIVETTINMAHSLSYKLVAEGVENEETAFLLKKMGCDKIQGYWLCHPIPLAKLKPWLEEYRPII